MSRFRQNYERSIALHAAVAERLLRDPSVIVRARAKVQEWLARGGSSAQLWHRWEDILRLPPEQIASFLTSREEEAAWLRKASPFAGVLPERERQQILRSVRYPGEGMA